MSFVRTLATLAVGYAAAKGVQNFSRMGGMAGMKQALGSNPALAGMQDQMGAMMEKFGVPGGANAFQNMGGQMAGAAGAMGGMAGLGGLMSAFGGAAAAGTEQTAEMMDVMAGNKVASTAVEENAKLMIRAMLQAAKADGEIDADEQAKIMEHLADAGPEEKAFVEEELAKPVDPMALAADTSEQMKAQVYATSLMAVKVDTMKEAEYMNTLAAALGLSEETKAQVHQAMGVS